MFNFFDSDKNPFMVMMNHMAESSADAQEDKTAAGDADARLFMEQAVKIQMEMAKSMCLMPFAMMQGLAETVGFQPGKSKEAGPGGFKLGNFEIPPELLQMVLQLDMKPENLEKLQKVLEYVFSAIPEPKQDQE